MLSQCIFSKREVEGLSRKVIYIYKRDANSLVIGLHIIPGNTLFGAPV